MRVERVYEWKRNVGLSESDPKHLDPKLRPAGTTRIGHLSDTHLGKGEPGERQRQLRRWLEVFDGLSVDGVIHSGDLVESPEDKEIVEAAFSQFDKMSVPVVGVPGNHDVVEPGEVSEVTRRWGPFPRHERINGVRVWLVDTMAWPAVEERSDREREAAREAGFYSRGGMGPEQRKNLARAIDDEWTGPQIIVAHHHLRQPVPEKPWYEENADLMRPMEDEEELVSLARSFGVEIFLHGHRHQYVTPYMPFGDVVFINGGSSTREVWPKRVRMIDIAQEGGAARIWELVRFK